MPKLSPKEMAKRLHIDWEKFEEISKSLEKLQVLVQRYRSIGSDVSNLVELEQLKRDFLAELEYLTINYGVFRKFKSGNHVYLEDEAKRLKAETIDSLLQSGEKITRAENLYYKEPSHIEQLSLILKFRESFEKVEKLHSLYGDTLQAIIQSVSIAGKEMSLNKGTGNNV
jgi:hypothetical protein